MLEGIVRLKMNFVIIYYPHVVPNPSFLLWATKGVVGDWQCYLLFYCILSRQWKSTVSDSHSSLMTQLFSCELPIGDWGCELVFKLIKVSGLCCVFYVCMWNLVPLVAFTSLSSLFGQLELRLDCGKPLSPALVMRKHDGVCDSVASSKWVVLSKHSFLNHCCLWRWICSDWDQYQVMDQSHGF